MPIRIRFPLFSIEAFFARAFLLGRLVYIEVRPSAPQIAALLFFGPFRVLRSVWSLISLPSHGAPPRFEAAEEQRCGVVVRAGDLRSGNAPAAAALRPVAGDVDVLPFILGVVVQRSRSRTRRSWTEPPSSWCCSSS